MTDGGVADALPVGEAIRRGARRIMVIRSRKGAYAKKSGLAETFLRWSVRHHRSLEHAIAGRAERYNRAVALIRHPPGGIEIIEICPPQNFRASRLSRNPSVLREGYNQGRTMATEAMKRWGENGSFSGREPAIPKDSSSGHNPII